MDRSVETSALPRDGIVMAFDAYRSYPAAKADPRVGMVASGESFFTRSGGCEVEVSLGTAVPLPSLCPLVVDAMADDGLLLEGF